MTDTHTPTTEHPMPRAVDCPFAPPPALKELQATTPISRVKIWDGTSPWLITRHEHLRTLLRDPRVSADVSHPGFPHNTASGKASYRQRITFAFLDDPDHARLRRAAGGTCGDGTVAASCIRCRPLGALR